MPTGYTADIYDGNVSFEDFLLTCARAFGACIGQKDDPISHKPRLQQESSYYEEQLVDAKEKYENLSRMTSYQIVEYGRLKKQEEINYYYSRINEINKLQERYTEMMDKVLEWNPPSPDHRNLKSFMIEQIKSSVELDCNKKYSMQALEEYSNKDPSQFHKDALESAKNDINYYKKHRKEEQQRISDRNQWIKALYESIGKEIS